jgi:ABC-type transport system substrate-binding protein
VINWTGPWGTGPYRLVEGFSTPKTRSDRIVFEANPHYWDTSRLPRLRRIIFDNTLDQHEAVELLKTSEGRVDLVTGLRPLDTLQVAQSPFATVVKMRGSRQSVFGQFNMWKVNSPWRDVRLRQAVNYAINRADLIRYATKGNGVIIPALLPEGAFGYNADLKPYPFDPTKAQHLLQEVGHPNGLALTLIAPEELEVQATVVHKMLEHSGFTVTRQMLTPVAFNQKTVLRKLDQSPEQQPWDIALTTFFDADNFSLYHFYHYFAVDGLSDWVLEEPTLRHLYEAVLATIDRERQQQLIRQMEQHTQDQAYFLFLYNPISLYAVNKAVEFVPYVHTILKLDATSVTEQHWSVRKQKAMVEE